MKPSMKRKLIEHEERPARKKAREKGKEEPGNLAPDLVCSTCNKTFSMVKNFKRHILLHHSSTLPCYKCTECEKTATTKYNLKIHFETVHQIKVSLDEIEKNMNEPIKNSKKGITFIFITVKYYYISLVSISSRSSRKGKKTNEWTRSRRKRVRYMWPNFTWYF